MINEVVEITTIRRFGMRPSVVSEYKNKHKKICICHQRCKYFRPDTPSTHCEIANSSFELSKKVGIVLVMECDRYEVKEA